MKIVNLFYVSFLSADSELIEGEERSQKNQLIQSSRSRPETKKTIEMEIEMETERAILSILDVPSEPTNNLTSGEGAIAEEALNSPQTKADNLRVRLVTPEQSISKISPGYSATESPVIQTLQPQPLLNVVGIQHLEHLGHLEHQGSSMVRDRSQEQPVRSLELSAQVVQTKEGPRLVLEGLRGLQLDQKQLEEIREVAVRQLYTGQVLARLQGRIPPSRVSLTVRGQFSPATPMIQNQQEPRLFARLPQSVIQHGQFIHHEGRGRVLLLPSNILRAYEARASEKVTEDVKMLFEPLNDGQDFIQPTMFVLKCDDIKTEVKEEAIDV